MFWKTTTGREMLAAKAICEVCETMCSIRSQVVGGGGPTRYHAAMPTLVGDTVGINYIVCKGEKETKYKEITPI